MRLYLLPISTRRTLLYAQRLAAHEPIGASDKVASWAARTWSAWESKEAGWQRRVVAWGNYAFRRIPFEEWGLKSVPPAGARRPGRTVELVFPSRWVRAGEAEGTVERLATERRGLHGKRLAWCLVGMPVVAPLALVPVIPNLPFFFLAYRAWSHWRALSGGRHLQWLVKNKLLVLTPSKELDEIYADGRQHDKHGLMQDKGPAGEKHGYAVEEKGLTGEQRHEDKGCAGDEKNHTGEESERVLLSRRQAAKFSSALGLTAVEVELERAIWQVQRSIRRDQGR